MTGLEAFVICFCVFALCVTAVMRATMISAAREREAEAMQAQATANYAHVELQASMLERGVIDPDAN